MSCINAKDKVLPYFLFILFLSQSAFGSDGMVNIHGTLHSNSCNVSQDSQDILVDMGTISTKQFINGGEASPYNQFVISLIDCGPEATAVSIEFAGENDASEPALLAIEKNEHSASGVGIAILDSTKKLVNVNSIIDNLPLSPNAQKIDLIFYSQFRPNGLPVRAGQANSSATFRLLYF